MYIKKIETAAHEFCNSSTEAVVINKISDK